MLDNPDISNKFLSFHINKSKIIKDDLFKFINSLKHQVRFNLYFLKHNIENELKLPFLDFFLENNLKSISQLNLANNMVIAKEFGELEQMLFEQGELGSRTEFVKAFGEQPLGKFIRSILGIDVNAAKQAFAGISHQNFNSQQIRFIDTIINFLTVNGIIDPKMLFEPPFTDVNSGGITALYDGETTGKIIALINEINHNAEVA
ncbi:MAG: type I restriction-modification enzyme R subunit C-terminal domain-containing protein [Bacteroidales bacterium]